MIDWPTVVATVAGSALTTAVVGWSMGKLVEHWLIKEAHRAQVRFSKLHEKRAEVLAEIYRHLSNIDIVFRSLPKTEQEIDLEAHRQKVDFMLEEMKQAGIYFRNHALYFEPALKEKLDRYLMGTWVFWGMTTVIADAMEGMSLERKRQGLNILLPGMVDAHHQVGPLLAEVEQEFRKILEG